MDRLARIRRAARRRALTQAEAVGGPPAGGRAAAQVQRVRRRDRFT
ncbi:hypothetical protein I552_4154 [Mycobacterium xenopi 3993]|nr:hypothetical protein I552_4154 [Mycobacterium xenopi 3993]